MPKLIISPISSPPVVTGGVPAQRARGATPFPPPFRSQVLAQHLPRNNGGGNLNLHGAGDA